MNVTGVIKSMHFKAILVGIVSAITLSSAFAVTDSYVTLYGIGTVGMDYTTDGNKWAFKFQDYGSRIGFKGADRLDAISSVIWKVENAVNLGGHQSGGQGTWGYREAWVGYEHDILGTLRLGRGKNQFELLVSEFDLFSGNATLANTFNNAWSSRFSRAIFYDSPTWKSLTMGASYSAHPHQNQSAQEKYAWVVKYAQPTFTLYTAYHQENHIVADVISMNGSYTAGTQRIRNIAAGAQIKPIEGLMLGTLYKHTQMANKGDKQCSRDTALFIAQYKTGNITPRLGWVYQFKAKTKAAGSDIEAANMYIAGLDYRLSKRTYVFAEYSFINNNAQNNFATTSIPSTVTDTLGRTFYKNPQGLALGMVTNF
jgi:predicted porin